MIFLQAFMWFVAIILGLFIIAVVFGVAILVCYGGAALVGKVVDRVEARFCR